MTAHVEIKKIGDVLMLPLPDEILQQIKVEIGQEISITVENNCLIARPTEIAPLEQRIDKIMDELLETRKSAYESLAEGA